MNTCRKYQQLFLSTEDPQHHLRCPFSSSRVEERTWLKFGDVCLLSSEIGIVDFDTSKTLESKIVGEPLSISATESLSISEAAWTDSNNK